MVCYLRKQCGETDGDCELFTQTVRTAKISIRLRSYILKTQNILVELVNFEGVGQRNKVDDQSQRDVSIQFTEHRFKYDCTAILAKKQEARLLEDFMVNINDVLDAIVMHKHT